jgi:hypothetical protein
MSYLDDLIKKDKNKATKVQVSYLDGLIKKDKNNAPRSQNIIGLFDAKNGNEIKYRLCQTEIPLWKVYELTCHCGDKYIGQTSDTMVNRLQEHFISRFVTSSTIEFERCGHLSKHCKTINDIKYKILFSDITSEDEALYLEALHIKENRISKKLFNFNKVGITYREIYEFNCLGCNMVTFSIVYLKFLHYYYFLIILYL